MPYRVRVFDQQISNLFDRMGEVGRFGAQLNREILVRATASAPVRSGTIKRSHRNNGVLKAGRYRVRGTISNSARHALWVHEGVKGRIYPVRSDRLHIPAGGGYGARTVRSVAGQAANPWIEQAAQTVLLRRGLL